ncbi:D-inositol-3-phosphate glycosyltransferase [Candidatus Lokiarchaeum ossiferum]|uniref:D-inositol-3-phosphate glycosyltransferase n=1 Tax=Candidatus Lokiarchaeum ossiferum TaxID=2951803 RepID=A0ABY6HXB4_9ARCH|nr:D-inositol-3-phosphate glycosyltransferase [Candidatus Lokiarchaeum sp. B-35]
MPIEEKDKKYEKLILIEQLMKENPRNIAFTIESFFPSITGPNKEAFGIARRIVHDGFRPSIFTSHLDTKDCRNEEIFDAVPVKRYKIYGKIMRFVFTPQMYGELKKKNLNLIHAFNYRSIQTEIAYKIAKKKKIPLIFNPCGQLLSYKHVVSGFKQLPYILYDILTWKKIIKRADKIIVESQLEYDEALTFGVSQEKLALIPMGIDSAKYYKPKTFYESTSKNPLKIIFVGRLSRNRNLEPILRAMLLVKDVELRIIGAEMKTSGMLKGGYLDELQQWVQNHDLSDKITFIGPKYDQDLIEEFQNADVFVYTSLYENFGQTIQEAAASGLPIISTRTGFASDFIEESKNGYFVNPHDEKQIAKYLEKLKDKQLKQLFSEYSHQKIRAHYNWDIIIKQFIQIYNECEKKYQ